MYLLSSKTGREVGKILLAARDIREMTDRSETRNTIIQRTGFTFRTRDSQSKFSKGTALTQPPVHTAQFCAHITSGREIRALTRGPL